MKNLKNKIPAFIKKNLQNKIHFAVILLSLVLILLTNGMKIFILISLLCLALLQKTRILKITTVLVLLFIYFCFYNIFKDKNLNMLDQIFNFDVKINKNKKTIATASKSSTIKQLLYEDMIVKMLITRKNTIKTIFNKIIEEIKTECEQNTYDKLKEMKGYEEMHLDIQKQALIKGSYLNEISPIHHSMLSDGSFLYLTNSNDEILLIYMNNVYQSYSHTKNNPYAAKFELINSFITKNIDAKKMCGEKNFLLINFLANTNMIEELYDQEYDKSGNFKKTDEENDKLISILMNTLKFSNSFRKDSDDIYFYCVRNSVFYKMEQKCSMEHIADDKKK